jgi:hypothetical protein
VTTGEHGSVTTDTDADGEHSLLSGLPRYQIVHANRLGITDPEEILQFAIANADQSDQFWFGGQRTVIVGFGERSPPNPR